MLDIMICLYDRGTRDPVKTCRVFIHALDAVPYDELVGQLKGGLSAEELRDEIELTTPDRITTPDQKPYGMTVIGWVTGRAATLKRRKQALIRKTAVALVSPIRRSWNTNVRSAR